VKADELAIATLPLFRLMTQPHVIVLNTDPTERDTLQNHVSAVTACLYMQYLRILLSRVVVDDKRPVTGKVKKAERFYGGLANLPPRKRRAVLAALCEGGGDHVSTASM